ncbi:ATP-binding cassette sub-family C member 9-like isoform X2 [Asterias amurensis]|uniref:ATP-binding cassette sub-family C member 9-like isoform X2 n=1 Tax=Asterias amurensis TaxID=7602 RepID=UPI003AB6D67C
MSWDWICGTQESSTVKEDVIRLDNVCLLNGVASISHGIFLILFSLILLVVGCCTKYRQVNTKHLLVYPGHSIRWLISALLLVILLASIGEGVMTDETYQVLNQPTQPHLYVHSVLSFIAVLVSLIYYHHMELWQIPIMSPLLFLYWLSSLGHDIFRVLSLEYQNQDDVNIVLFDLTVIKIVIYFILMIVELNVIRTEFGPSFHQEKPVSSDTEQPEMMFRHDCVSYFSSVTLWWVQWLLNLGYKKHLEQTDLGIPAERHEAKFNHERFRKAFLEELESAKRSGKHASLMKVYARVYGRRLLWAAAVKLIGELVSLICPITVGLLTAYVTTLKYPTAESSQVIEGHHVTLEEFFMNGFVIVFIMFFSSFVGSTCVQNHIYLVMSQGIDVRTALQGMVYEKSLHLSTVATTGGTMDMGQITNHMSSDPIAMFFMFQMVNNLWVVPIQILAILMLLYMQMGYSALIGASIFFILSPIQMTIASYMGNQQKQILRCSDERLKKTNELLQGIKLLKLYAWEGLYCKAIEIIRAKELNFLLKFNIGYVYTLLLTIAAPVLVTIVGFGTYTALCGKPLTPDVTFSSLALFNALLNPLTLLPVSLMYTINGIVSTKRLEKFLSAPDVEMNEGGLTQKQTGTEIQKVKRQKPRSSKPTDLAKQSLLDGDANKEQAFRDEDSDIEEKPSYGNTPLEHDLDIKISDGCFRWYSSEAKFATLSDINVDIPKGTLMVVIGQIGSGKSSLISAILGEMTTESGMVQVRDRNQVAFAAQKPWLLNTSLQENILFSQPMDSKRYKRVIDACALRPDIDILPAGDQTEIGEKGINLSGGQKQRISVARTMYSGRDIVLLDDPLSALDVHVGRHLFEEGIMKLLIRQRRTVILVTHQLQYLNRADLIIEMKDGRIAAQGTLDDIIAADPDMYSEYNKAIELASESEAELEQSGYESESVKEERARLQQQVKTLSKKKKPTKGGDKTNGSGALVEKEEIERGSVSYSVYLYYFMNAGYFTILLSIILAVVNTGFFVGTNFWLSAWTEAGLQNHTDTTSAFKDYFSGYVGLNLAYLIFKMLASSALLWGALQASKRLALRMLRNIVKAPFRFFDVTPLGRIMNRFSGDLDTIDKRLITSFTLFMFSSMTLLSAVVVNVIVTPIFIMFCIPIAIIYLFLQRYFLATSRELQRLESVSKSPVLAYFSESLGGITTIRAFRQSQRFYDTIIERINANVIASLYLLAVNRWLAIRVICGQVNLYVRSSTEIEIQMNAVERVKHYSQVDTESYEGIEPPDDWPMYGTVTLENVSARYCHGMDPVLIDVSVEIGAKQKVGVCGRTGAGKSSLSLTLLRVLDVFKGRIIIDGVDIKSVPLTSLRSKISIIPQDPVLFEGTLRHNLDPCGIIETDEVLWHALEIAQLKDMVSSYQHGLDALVTEGGENFSVGQRQLFCLARAFLRKSRILIMDEATASIDLETDKILQRVVSDAFADCTVLTIAHRIATIMKSDKVLVLDNGKVAEYGTPNELLEIQDGLFASLVRDTNL